jgi:hypothetical protein
MSIDFQELESQFKKWNKDKNNFRANDYLKDIWQISIASLIENIVLLWKAGNKDVANNFRIQLQSTTKFYYLGIMFAKGHLHISNFILKLYVLHVFAGVTSL